VFASQVHGRTILQRACHRQWTGDGWVQEYNENRRMEREPYKDPPEAKVVAERAQEEEPVVLHWAYYCIVPLAAVLSVLIVLYGYYSNPH
jgi:hypothetical protein